FLSPSETSILSLFFFSLSNNMITYKSLPSEILVLIFQHLPSVADIAECRLVCKAWNDPAETAMFSKPLILYHEAKAEKVIRHLERHPAKGRCITDLTVTDYDDQRVMKRLLQLAFTPSIERLAGKVLDIFSSAIRLSAIYTSIIEIAENSPIPFDRLKTIPDTFVLNDLYGRTLLTFKDTLETVQLRLFNHDDTQDVLHRFHEFKQLKTLRLEEAEFNNIKELDAVLKGCHHLKELYLNVEILDQTTRAEESDLSNTSGSNAVLWQRMQVEKVPSLEKLEFVSPGYPLVVEYLLYKYPNVQDFRLDPMAMVEPSMDRNLTSQHFESILSSLKPLKKYSARFCMPPGDSLHNKCTAAKGDINSLTIQYPTKFIEDDTMNLHLDVTSLDEKTRQVHFTLEIPSIVADFSPLDLVREAGILPLERLELDFVNCAAVDGDRLFEEQISQSQETMVFLDILYSCPHIKQIKLTAHHVDDVSDMLLRAYESKVELRSLEICGAEVTQEALRCISYQCPQLKELILTTCYLAPNKHQNNTFYIRMDRTSFDHFIYTDKSLKGILRDKEDQDAAVYFGSVDRQMLVTWALSDIYLCLCIKETGKKIYFWIRAHHTADDGEPFAVCQEIFDLRPVKRAPLIHMTCNSIKSLTIQINIMSFFLKEELIRKCVESDYMSYPLEKGDIDIGEEEAVEEK
ncbi:hypothetical protein MBANPS3_007635, partial [Mucor bainieri]